MKLVPPRSTLTATLVPYTTLFRSVRRALPLGAGNDLDQVEVLRAPGVRRRRLRALDDRAQGDRLAGARLPSGRQADPRRARRHRLHPEGGRRAVQAAGQDEADRSEEHTSELQSLMRNSYAVFCLKKKK